MVQNCTTDAIVTSNDISNLNNMVSKYTIYLPCSLSATQIWSKSSMSVRLCGTFNSSGAENSTVAIIVYML